MQLGHYDIIRCLIVSCNQVTLTLHYVIALILEMEMQFMI